MSRVFLDIREPEEYNNAHVDGAVNLPPGDILHGAKSLQDIPRDTELVLYCVSGSRSNAAMHYLKDMGFTNLVNGINAQQVRAKYGIPIV